MRFGHSLFWCDTSSRSAYYMCSSKLKENAPLQVEYFLGHSWTLIRMFGLFFLWKSEKKNFLFLSKIHFSHSLTLWRIHSLHSDRYLKEKTSHLCFTYYFGTTPLARWQFIFQRCSTFHEMMKVTQNCFCSLDKYKNAHKYN